MGRLFQQMTIKKDPVDIIPVRLYVSTVFIPNI